jgi:hypothetical protein
MSVATSADVISIFVQALVSIVPSPPCWQPQRRGSRPIQRNGLRSTLSGMPGLLAIYNDELDLCLDGERQ